MNSLEDVTRLEIIDHTKCENCKGSGILHIEGQEISFDCPNCHGIGTQGRNVIFHSPSKKIDVSLQDEGRTLKIFINKRGE